MIQSMRKQEEDRLDDEADIMREMEMEDEDGQRPRRQTNPDVLVEDSQAAMPLGPDRGLESDEESEDEAEQLGPDGKPRRVWKKKGLKRQTRRVISTFSPCSFRVGANKFLVRPHFTKPDPKPQQPPEEESEDEAGIAETQQNQTNPGSEDEFPADEGESDYASDDSHSRKKRKTQKKPVKDTSTSLSKDGKKAEEGPVKTAARKIKATAHANYRRLKIKSKGGNGGKGRFGRKR
jgi:hypothetical protein